jgi:C-terminal processing protease CtpA/Prc
MDVGLPGGAHPGDTAQLPQGFSAFIPAARVIHPVTKTDWEGVGVKPDVEVSADKALETAHKLALERLKTAAGAAMKGR